MTFLFIVMFILSIIYGYVGYHVIRNIRVSVMGKGMLWLLILGSGWSSILPAVMRHKGYENTAVDLMSWAAYLSLGCATLMFAIFLVIDSGRILMGLTEKIALFFRPENPSHANGVDRGKRRFLAGSLDAGIIGGSVLLSGYGLFQARRKPEVIDVDIPFKGLPKDLDDLRIVQITDLHVGPTIKKEYVELITDQVMNLSPHMIVLTGDMVDGSTRRLVDDVAPMAGLKAPLGTFYVTGNHEYYSNAALWIDMAKRLGFDVLLNEHRIIKKGSGRLLVAGVTDYNGGRFSRRHRSDPEAAIAGAGPHHLKILLAHQPKSIGAAAKAGFDLQISGHTHGGQYFPGPFLVKMSQPYVSGLHQHGNTKIYISKGTGYWGPPMRLGVRSEISMIRLVAA